MPMTKADKQSKSMKNKWQDPEYRAMMLEKQKGIGLRTYR